MRDSSGYSLHTSLHKGNLQAEGFGESSCDWHDDDGRDEEEEWEQVT